VNEAAGTPNRAATDNLRIAKTRALIAPAVLEEEIPRSAEAAEFVGRARESVAGIVNGRDERLLAIVGPCSVHDITAVLDYATRLHELQQECADKIFVVMRVYFEKPRTTVGWKGYINDPGLDGSFKVNEGLRSARKLLADVTKLGLPVATEFLDTTFGQYYTDFISWGAIGARTVESQIHRQLASGLSMPVGFKNATNGGVGVAIDGITAATQPHLFPSLTKEGAPALLETTGNPDAHLVLRGGKEPNYDAASIRDARASLATRGIDSGIVVDCSHGNSSKDHEQQAIVARAVCQHRQQESGVVGLMLESHLVAGRQDEPVVYGQSITDACLDWRATVDLVREIYSIER